MGDDTMSFYFYYIKVFLVCRKYTYVTASNFLVLIIYFM